MESMLPMLLLIQRAIKRHKIIKSVMNFPERHIGRTASVSYTNKLSALLFEQFAGKITRRNY